MGFEQLAALKEQLAAAAAATAAAEKKRPEKTSKRPENSKRSENSKGPGRKPKADIDPVVIAISRLQRKFPATFPKKPLAKLPLKLGIHEELHAQADSLGLSKEEITNAIKTWCQGSRYWACLTEGAARIDLAGQPSGAVTAPEAGRARHLERRRPSKKASARKKSGAKQEADQEANPEATPGEANREHPPAGEANAQNSAPEIKNSAEHSAPPAESGGADTPSI